MLRLVTLRIFMKKTAHRLFGSVTLRILFKSKSCIQGVRVSNFTGFYEKKCHIGC